MTIASFVRMELGHPKTSVNKETTRQKHIAIITILIKFCFYIIQL